MKYILLIVEKFSINHSAVVEILGGQIGQFSCSLHQENPGFGLGERHERGELLVDFCEENGLGMRGEHLLPVA